MAERRRGVAHPDLLAAVEAGLVHPFDFEWVRNVPYEYQPATVQKLIHAKPVEMSHSCVPERVRLGLANIRRRED